MLECSQTTRLFVYLTYSCSVDAHFLYILS